MPRRVEMNTEFISEVRQSLSEGVSPLSVGMILRKFKDLSAGEKHLLLSYLSNHTGICKDTLAYRLKVIQILESMTIDQYSMEDVIEHRMVKLREIDSATLYYDIMYRFVEKIALEGLTFSMLNRWNKESIVEDWMNSNTMSDVIQWLVHTICEQQICSYTFDSILKNASSDYIGNEEVILYLNMSSSTFNNINRLLADDRYHDLVELPFAGVNTLNLYKSIQDACLMEVYGTIR
jgi:hypothetical protein